MKSIRDLNNLKYFLPLILLFSTPLSASIHLAPAVRDKPDDLIYEVGTTNNTLVWVFEAEESNDEPSRYSATLDGVPIENHTLAGWNDLTEVVINVDGLALGNYVVSVEINDTGTDALQAPSAFDSVNIHIVEDIANPFPTTTSTPPSTSSTTAVTTSTATSNEVSEAVSRVIDGKSSTDTSDSAIPESTTNPSLPISFFSIVISLLSVGILTWSMRT